MARFGSARRGRQAKRSRSVCWQIEQVGQDRVSRQDRRGGVGYDVDPTPHKDGAIDKSRNECRKSPKPKSKKEKEKKDGGRIERKGE